MNRIDDSIAVGAIVGFVIGLLDCVKSKSDLVIADRTSTLPKLHRAIVVSKLCHVAETGICVCLAVVNKGRVLRPLHDAAPLRGAASYLNVPVG